ncbi:MAG: alpha/beta hydrolase [Campylobacterota bacterium]|nr:alpha/beta hydrolase [Campylobacterota bacterium]
MAIKEIAYNNTTFHISYELLNPKQSKNIIILHGWGSNKEIMKQAFQTTLPQYRHIYIDMPGFGKSSNPMVLTTQEYAKIIQRFLDRLTIEADIIMGHSFGGKVATLLDPPTLVLLSSAGIITQKPWSVKVKIATFKLLKPLGFAKIRELFVSPDAKGMSHEMYETFKNVVDEDFESEFGQFKHNALLFWGKEDTATPLYTGEKIHKIIQGSHFYPLDGDHYFFLAHKAFIAQEIQERVENLA